MTDKKRKKFYWTFKLASVIISCLFPIWAILEKFPIWREKHGIIHTIGIGGVLILFVVLVIFRRTIFNFFRDRLNLKHAPPLTIWLVLLIISYIMVFLGSVMQDMTTVFWMGLIGCGIGTFLTYIAESRFGEVKKNE